MTKRSLFWPSILFRDRHLSRSYFSFSISTKCFCKITKNIMDSLKLCSNTSRNSCIKEKMNMLINRSISSHFRITKHLIHKSSQRINTSTESIQTSLNFSKRIWIPKNLFHPLLQTLMTWALLNSKKSRFQKILKLRTRGLYKYSKIRCKIEMKKISSKASSKGFSLKVLKYFRKIGQPGFKT